VWFGVVVLRRSGAGDDDPIRSCGHRRVTVCKTPVVDDSYRRVETFIFGLSWFHPVRRTTKDLKEAPSRPSLPFSTTLRNTHWHSDLFIPPAFPPPTFPSESVCAHADGPTDQHTHTHIFLPLQKPLLTFDFFDRHTTMAVRAQVRKSLCLYFLRRMRGKGKIESNRLCAV
jgi:hypothetical protein